MSVLPIDEVRERLHNLADYAGGGSFPSLAGDLRALLEDHARLRAALKGALDEQFGSAE